MIVARSVVVVFPFSIHGHPPLSDRRLSVPEDTKASAFRWRLTVVPARTVEWSIGGNEVVRSPRLRVGELGSSWIEFKDLLRKSVLFLFNRLKKKRF